MELLVYQNPEAKERGINPFDHGPLHTDMWKTEGLKQALDQIRLRCRLRRRAPRRGEEPRQGAHLLLPHRQPRLGPEEPAARTVEPLQRARRTRARASASSRSPTGPSSTSGNTSSSRTSRSCRSTSPRQRPTVELRRRAAHGRRRSLPRWRGDGRSARDYRTLGPLPHAGLLPADRRGRERGGDPVRSDPGNAADHHQRTAGPRRSTRMQAAPAWRRRSRRGISDGRRTTTGSASTRPTP